MPDSGDYGTINRGGRYSRLPSKPKRRSIDRFMVGKLQRQSPLPVGLYWIDIIDSRNQADFAAWTAENTGKVRIIISEHFEAPDCSELQGSNVFCPPSRDWVKFQVLSPVTWNPIQFGFPNVIEEGEIIESSSDTASVPGLSADCDIGCQAEKVAIAGGIILGGVALILVIKAIK